MKGSDEVKERRYLSRAGFSLVELIIAIAILTVFVGGAALSLTLLRNADTRGLASGINDSLTDLKALTESHKGPYYMHIYKTDDGFYANYSEAASGGAVAFTVPTDTSGDKRLGASTMTVKADISGSDVEITGDTYVTVSIQKKDGAYKMAPETFYIYNGARLDYKVILAMDTGLHYMEQQ
ncbi:MAG: prepilin-type N-terminal cleavage/methylation domain-containing protein [Eubacterium sp.]|nr:prepilin-type N-terminal cleavage/methylation domain-containing protein [Eubacterium sp.]